MKKPKNNAIYWLFKIVSVLVSCAFPVWAIYERFPVWVTVHGKTQSIGTGGILIFFVLLIICRKSVFGFIRERLRLRHAPPLLVWVILIALSYAILYVAVFLLDIINVFWMGFVGCLIGSVLTFIAENFLRVHKKKEEVTNG